MNYVRLKLKIEPFSTGTSDILAAGLDFFGYEGFQEEEPFLLAFIPSNRFNRTHLDRFLGNLDLDGVQISASDSILPSKNWNEAWEKDFQPVIVDNLCIIRAPFHTPSPGLKNIVIEPKMSFGTGHHETTRLMIEQIHSMSMSELDVLDMGCGTGILGIYALMSGARQVTAVDIDEWAYTNSLENFRRNIDDHDSYKVIMGGC